jgi:hypothetical protein
VWTDAPTFVSVPGELAAVPQFYAGDAQFALGVRAWRPMLPDP